MAKVFLREATSPVRPPGRKSPSSPRMLLPHPPARLTADREFDRDLARLGGRAAHRSSLPTAAAAHRPRLANRCAATAKCLKVERTIAWANTAVCSCVMKIISTSPASSSVWPPSHPPHTLRKRLQHGQGFRSNVGTVWSSSSLLPRGIGTSGMGEFTMFRSFPGSHGNFCCATDATADS
jgi:hypothetical protein